MVTNIVQSRTYAAVDSVSSLSVSLKRHPNSVKSSNQLKYLVLVQITPSSSTSRVCGESNRDLKLTTHVEALKCAYPVEFVHGYLKDLPSTISACNENCALLAPSDAFCPLIRSDYTTRSHLVRGENFSDIRDIIELGESSKQKKKCASTSKTRTIGEMFAKMKEMNDKPEKLKTSTEGTDFKSTTTTKMQYGDHEYCSTKYPLVKAFQKQASKIRTAKPSAKAAVKTEEPLPDVSAAGSSKRQWIDTSSSSDDEQKNAQVSTTSKTLTKRQRLPTSQDPSQLKAEVTELDGVAKPKLISRPKVAREGASTSKRSSRSASTKLSTQSQTNTVPSFVKKSSK